MTELSTLENPVYLFEFKNDQSKVAYTFIAEDESLYTNRYNKFTITEKANPDRLNGEVQLSLAGYYTYRVFEQVSTTNLIVPDAEPIETGKVYVYGSEDTEYTHNYPTENIVYNS